MRKRAEPSGITLSAVDAALIKACFVAAIVNRRQGAGIHRRLN